MFSGGFGAYLIAQLVKNPPAMQETRVPSLGWKDPLEKETAAHSSILACKVPWMAEPGRLLSMGSQRVGMVFPPKRRGSLRFLRPLEMRPSSIAPHPVESREAPPNSTVSVQ